MLQAAPLLVHLEPLLAAMAAGAATTMAEAQPPLEHPAPPLVSVPFSFPVPLYISSAVRMNQPVMHALVLLMSCNAQHESVQSWPGTCALQTCSCMPGCIWLLQSCALRLMRATIALIHIQHYFD